jgi:ADP-ribose pyrophosphatase
MSEPITTFSQNDYEILNRETLYEGFMRLARYSVVHRTFSGGWTAEFQREILERAPAAAVLPYDPILDQVILIEQFRAAAISNPQSPWLIEIVAGLCEPNEKPDEVALREAIEEAGCKILDLYPISEYFVSPGGSNELLTLYCGRVDATEAGGVHGVADENEDIRSFTVSLDEAYALVQEGQIKSSPAIISIQWLILNREWLKQLWQTK